MLPSTRQNGVGIATVADFGAGSSRPASLLCTLRTHQSPGEWQHWLPACSLALTGRDLHPLDFIKWFPLLHCRFLHFHAYPSAICRCLTSSARLPFPHPAHRTGRADLPHPTLGERFTMSPTGLRVRLLRQTRPSTSCRGVTLQKNLFGLRKPVGRRPYQFVFGAQPLKQPLANMLSTAR
jgi:hypothetical protein